MSPDAVRKLLDLKNLSDVKAFQIADILERWRTENRAILDLWKVQESSLASHLLHNNPPGLPMQSTAIDCAVARTPVLFSNRLPEMGQLVLVFGPSTLSFKDERNQGEDSADGVGQWSIHELIKQGAYWLPGEYAC